MEDQISSFYNQLEGELKEAALEIREITFGISPEIVEEYKWSMPHYSYKGLLFGLMKAKDHLNISFHRGVELLAYDEDKLLTGKGKELRHIVIKRKQDIDLKALKKLIIKAMELNEKQKTD